MLVNLTSEGKDSLGCDNLFSIHYRQRILNICKLIQASQNDYNVCSVTQVVIW